MYKIVMPSGGQTTDESYITKWLKKTGDKISRGDILFEIETDKALLEVESFCEGYLRAVEYGEGETVATGETVAYIGSLNEPLPGGGESAAAAAGTEPVKSPAVTGPAPAARGGGRILASPLAKKLARENGVALSEIPASGVIKKRDVLDYTSKPAYIPYYTVGADADMSECMLFIKRSGQITLDGIIAKCAAAAEKKFPEAGPVNILNFGPYGTDCFTSVLKLREGCVLAVGAVKEKAVSAGRQIVSRDMMNITGSFDPRAIGAETAAQFMAEIKRLIESPALLLLILAI